MRPSAPSAETLGARSDLASAHSVFIIEAVGGAGASLQGGALAHAPALGQRVPPPPLSSRLVPSLSGPRPDPAMAEATRRVPLPQDEVPAPPHAALCGLDSGRSVRAAPCRPPAVSQPRRPSRPDTWTSLSEPSAGMPWAHGCGQAVRPAGSFPFSFETPSRADATPTRPSRAPAALLPSGGSVAASGPPRDWRAGRALPTRTPAACVLPPVGPGEGRGYKALQMAFRGGNFLWTKLCDHPERGLLAALQVLKPRQ